MTNTYAIVGGSLWGNRGAEAMIVTTIGRVRERDPDARFLVMSYFPDRDLDLVQDPAVRVLDAQPAAILFAQLPFALLGWLTRRLGLRLPAGLAPSPMNALRGCRALFDVTGISFHDGRLAVVAYNVLCLWPALLLGVPVIRLSQAMGPVRHPLNRVPARWITGASMHTYARGRRTAEYIRELGVSEDRWSVAADLAFAYRPEDSLTRENEDLVAAVVARLAEAAARGTGIVALVPSSLVWKRSRNGEEDLDYVGLLHELVDAFRTRGLHVLVVPNATRAGVDTLRNNDIAVIEELRRRTTSSEIDDGVTHVDFDLNTASIRRLLEPCRLVVTSRFHAMVAALALAVPTIVMGWSHKYVEVLEMFGCEEDTLHFADADRALLPMVDRVLAEHEETRRRILAALPGVTASARSQFDLLDRLPDGGSSGPLR
jgi:colanic acid/amylovoran biosynthesis protein